MFKETLLLLSLFSISTSSTYAPFHQRKFEYSVSDLCSYDDDIFQYVKPCQTNYQCKSVSGSDSHDISTCKEYVKTIKKFGDTCIADKECDSGLECSTSSKCVSNNNYNAYGIKDRVSNDYYYYCNDDYRATGSSCVQKTSSGVSGIGDNLCHQAGTDNANAKTVRPNFGYICGQNTWQQYSSTNPNYPHHYKSETKMNRIGTVDDGEYVKDERACISGFALKFYMGTSLDAPTSGETTQDKVCVTLNGVETGKNNYVIYKYTLNNKEYTYNTEDTTSVSHQMTKLELFKEYVKKAEGITCNAGEGHV